VTIIASLLIFVVCLVFGQVPNPSELPEVIDNSQYAVEGEYIEQNGKFRSITPLLPSDEVLGILQDDRSTTRSEGDILLLVDAYVAGLVLAYQDNTYEALEELFAQSEIALLRWYVEPLAETPEDFFVRVGKIYTEGPGFMVPLRLKSPEAHAVYSLYVEKVDEVWRIYDIVGSTMFEPYAGSLE